jgi:hypothetical protein
MMHGGDLIPGGHVLRGEPLDYDSSAASDQRRSFGKY